VIEGKSRRRLLQVVQQSSEPGGPFSFWQAQNLQAANVLGAVMGFSQQKSCIQGRKFVHGE
jgi:hypothetical protein